MILCVIASMAAKVEESNLTGALAEDRCDERCSEDRCLLSAERERERRTGERDRDLEAERGR